jgi:hypothetical protein
MRKPVRSNTAVNPLQVELEKILAEEELTRQEKEFLSYSASQSQPKALTWQAIEKMLHQWGCSGTFRTWSNIPGKRDSLGDFTMALDTKDLMLAYPISYQTHPLLHTHQAISLVVSA